MNIFTRIGNWIERAPLAERVTALEKQLENYKDLKDRLVKVEMYIGFKQPGSAKDDIRHHLEVWGRLNG